jgi:hypothetical protein
MPATSIRANALARTDPTFREPRASARPESMARPQKLLGTRPGRDVAEFTELARALSGDQAAFIDAHFELPRGNRIDLLA